MRENSPEFVCSFVGPAGTGKSYRAEMAADRMGADYIIDDGLIIHRSQILAGRSAKAEKNRISAIRRAMFEFEDHRMAVIDFIRSNPVRSIMVIATSDDMAERICDQLGIMRPVRCLRIEDIATPDEMADARNLRQTRGQHVIPASHVQVRQNFAGMLVGRLRDLFRSRPHAEGEKTIVRPPFSFHGKVHIEPETIEQLIRIAAGAVDQVSSVSSLRVGIADDDALDISVGVRIRAGGKNMMAAAGAVIAEVSHQIRYYAGLEVKKVSVRVQGIEF